MYMTNVTLDPSSGAIWEWISAPGQPLFYLSNHIYSLLSDDYRQYAIEMDLYGVPGIQSQIDKALSSFQSIMEDRFPVPSESSSDIKGEDDNATLWAVRVIHPSIDEYILEKEGPKVMDEDVRTLRHHTISRVFFRQGDFMQRRASFLSLPNTDGVAVYILDAAGRCVANSREQPEHSRKPMFAPRVGRVDNGQNLKDFAEHQWTIVVEPTGKTYWFRFDLVAFGWFLLALATVLTCFVHRKVACACTDRIRSSKSEQRQEKDKNTLLQAQQERQLVCMKRGISALVPPYLILFSPSRTNL
jgi:hypothetical protein